MKKAVRWMAWVGAWAGVMTTAGGCAPLVVGGAMVGGAIVATDRRSPGIQIEDQAIESRVGKALAARYEKGSVSVNVNSYNRRVLLTGEVRNAADKAEVERIAAAQENVRTVTNELYVGELSTFYNRNNDTSITAKVKAALLNERNLPSNAILVHTSRSVVYLMGRVSEPEGNLAARTASRVDGVRQVVALFEYMTDEEWKALKVQTPPPPPESQRK
jgi:osmotically-inducible protein OsmY